MKTRNIALAGVTAALYVVLTMISTAFGLSSGVIQLRLSEMLCVLPCFFGAAVPGLFVGCVISNILSGCVIWDVIFGSIATLLGAVLTYLLRKNRYLAVLPPIISNAVIVPFILIYAYEVPDAFWFLVLTVGAGELISAGIFGEIFYTIVKKTGIINKIK